MFFNPFVALILIWVSCGNPKGTNCQSDDVSLISESTPNGLKLDVTVSSVAATDSAADASNEINNTSADNNVTSDDSMFITHFNFTYSQQETTTHVVTTQEPTTTLPTTTTTLPTTTTTEPTTTTTTTTTTPMPTTLVETTTDTPSTTSTMAEDTTLEDVPMKEPTDFVIESSSTSKTATTEVQPDTSNSSANYTQNSLRECTVVGESLMCHGSIKCFGEGEIDCDVSEQKEGLRKKEKYTEHEAKGSHSYREGHIHRGRKVEVTIHGPCKLSGPIHCIPSPSTSKCRGKGKCNLSEMSAKESVEDWIIAVICISIGLGLFLLVILVYVTYASWKKLRVQPQLASSTSYVPGQNA